MESSNKNINFDILKSFNLKKKANKIVYDSINKKISLKLIDNDLKIKNYNMATNSNHKNANDIFSNLTDKNKTKSNLKKNNKNYFTINADEISDNLFENNKIYNLDYKSFTKRDSLSLIKEFKNKNYQILNFNSINSQKYKIKLPVKNINNKIKYYKDKSLILINSQNILQTEENYNFDKLLNSFNNIKIKEEFIKIKSRNNC